jgi:DNA-binding HxlR family transcriptional regulator
MTSGQREVLNALTEGPKSVGQIARDSTEGPGPVAFTDQQIRGRLRRTEAAGLVRRITDPPNARWELTHAGRSALQLTT